MKNIIKFLIVLGKFTEDIFISIGLFLIIIATFTVNKVAGIYAMGIISLIIGLLMARKPPGGDKN